ncbi:MAG: HTH domain-containing protein [Collinsella sp.]|nr:HTH domain-containing protein [Collinsella sp.]
MNTRQRRLLEEMLHLGHPETLAYFAQKLGCSTKTVTQDTKALNALLASQDLETKIESKRGTGIVLRRASSDGSRLTEFLELDEGSSMTSIERFYRGMLFISTVRPDGCTDAELARHLFTNARQIKVEIAHWNDLLALFGQKVVRRRGLLLLTGEEAGLRAAIMYYFYLFSPAYQRKIFEMEVDGCIWDAVKKFSDAASPDGSAVLALNAEHCVGYYLAFVLLRLRSGHSIGGGARLSKMDVSSGIVRSFRRHIAPLFGEFAEGEKEIDYALAMFAVNSMTLGEASQLELSERPKHLFYVVRSAIEELLGFSMPLEMCTGLERLVCQAHARATNCFPVAVRNVTPMKRVNLSWFLRLERALRHTAGIGMDELLTDDLVRIAMLTHTLWDASTRRVRRAVLVSDASFEQAVYAKARLNSNLAFMQVVECMTSAELMGRERAAELSDIDFVISLSALETALPLCRVSDAVDDDDLVDVASFALTVPVSKELVELPLDFGRLECNSLTVLADALFWDVLNAGVVRGGNRSFKEQCQDNFAMSADVASSAIVMREVERTCVRIYETPRLNAVQPIPCVALLLVREDGPVSLEDAVAGFSACLKNLSFSQRSYSLPFELMNSD